MGEWSFGQLMGQNSKVVHWPARLSDTVELQLIIQVVIRETTVLSTCSSDSTTPRHMMLERDAHSNWAKTVTPENKTVDTGRILTAFGGF
jgi:hypothetical protein